MPLFGRPPSGFMALPGDDLLEIGDVPSASTSQSAPSWHCTPEFEESVLHWSGMSSDPHVNKALWITTDNMERCSEIASTISKLLSSPDNEVNLNAAISLVDVSRTHRVFCPLIPGLVRASPGYRDAIWIRPPPPFSEYFRDFPLRRAAFRMGENDVSPLEDDDNNEPLKQVYKCFAGNGLGSGSTLSPEMPRIILAIHGVRNAEQADELYETIEGLEVGLGDYYQAIRIVVITDPQLLRHLSDHAHAIMNHVCTLYVSDVGPVLYSGKFSSPPIFYESLFLLLLDGIHRMGSSEAERIRSSLADLEILVAGEPANNTDDMNGSTRSIFSKLHQISIARKQILELFSEIPMISQSQINKRLVKDNIKIAEMLERLFEFDSYKGVSSLPQEYVLAVMNLTNHVRARPWFAQ
ncbi:hypothetical protein B0H14DRAFT_3431942 [Mycena olivaceomarginata]|nr:hypothetical protein B0H14DRAFT_3431942 [Mycena olivaceomarginata]